jgi:putative membrane protein
MSVMWIPAMAANGGRDDSPAIGGGAADPVISSPAMKLIAKWLLSAMALLFVAYVYTGVEVKSFTAALIAAFVIGLFNMVVRPVLVVLTLPVTVLTLGLFLFVINALMFWAAATVMQDFNVQGFLPALVGSLIYSAIGVVIESALERLFPKK